MFLGTADEFAAFQHFQESFCRGQLPFMGTDAMTERQEGLDAAVVGFERHHADQVGPFREALGLDERPDGVGAHELGSVEQGQAFFRLKADGLPTELFPDLGGGTHLAFVANFAHADDRKAQVGQGREVAGGTERALLVDDGQDIVVEHVDKPLNGDQLGAGMAVGERLGLEQEHQADDVGLHFFAGAAGVRHDEVMLELRQVFGGNRYVVQ